jgi:hypothetical protein
MSEANSTSPISTVVEQLETALIPIRQIVFFVKTLGPHDVLDTKSQELMAEKFKHTFRIMVNELPNLINPF